jgi:RNA polymerase sigma-70 factor (ECF subfamily)
MHRAAHARTDCVPDIGDRVWVDRIRAGDAVAFETVFRRLAPGLRSFTLQYVGVEQQAEDVVQELFLTLWRRRESLQVHSSIVSYLYVAARNRAINHLRRERVAQEWEQSRAALPPPTVSPADEGVLEAELARALQDVIDGMPERMRLVFVMSRQRKMTYDQIAESLGISVKTVETQMARALRRIRESLRELFG